MPTQLLHRRTSTIPRLPANESQLQAPQSTIVRSRLGLKGFTRPSRRGAGAPQSRIQHRESQTTAGVRTDSQVQRSDPLLCFASQSDRPSQTSRDANSLRSTKKLPYASSSTAVVVRAGLRRSERPGQTLSWAHLAICRPEVQLDRMVRVVCAARDVSAVVAHAYRMLCLTPKRDDLVGDWDWGSLACREERERAEGTIRLVGTGHACARQHMPSRTLAR